MATKSKSKDQPVQPEQPDNVRHLPVPQSAVPVNDDELVRVLQNSVYPGCKPESVRLVISYCRLNNLDPLLKPVHIVPMSVEVEIENPAFRPDGPAPQFIKVWQKVDVIMPGIGLYRIRAARAGDYMGLSAPEWGDDIQLDLGGVKMVVPEWCRVTAFKMINGEKVPFFAEEYWLENYANAGQSPAPNKMWKKRPRAQLLKCAKAQALREGWPDIVGAAPTAEEMEGKPIYADEIEPSGAIDVTPEPIAEPKPLRQELPPPKEQTITVQDVKRVTRQPKEQKVVAQQPEPATVEEPKDKWLEPYDNDDDQDDQPPPEPQPERIASPNSIKAIKGQMERAALSFSDLRKVKRFAYMETLADLKVSDFNAVLDWIKDPTGNAA